MCHSMRGPGQYSDIIFGLVSTFGLDIAALNMLSIPIKSALEIKVVSVATFRKLNETS